MSIATCQLGDFLSDPTRKPDWSQLTRLAGDGVAILFEELRRRMGALEGLAEDLSYDGAERQWTPRYRLGEAVLFVVRIRPGILEGLVTLDGALRERVLDSREVAKGIKEMLRNSPAVKGTTLLRVRLSNLARVRALVRLAFVKSKSFGTALTPK